MVVDVGNLESDLHHLAQPLSPVPAQHPICHPAEAYHRPTFYVQWSDRHDVAPYRVPFHPAAHDSGDVLANENHPCAEIETLTSDDAATWIEGVASNANENANICFLSHCAHPWVAEVPV